MNKSNSHKIPFNKPYLIGNELSYIEAAINNGKLSGDGIFSKKCQTLMESRYGFKKVLLTTSCTDALEMIALLLDIGPGDEVIMPSFNFVSAANAFVLRGAVPVFCDIDETMNIDPQKIVPLISKKTKALVVLHYGGVSSNMDAICTICRNHSLVLIEDAAHAVEAFFVNEQGKELPLGSFGQFSTFSFHETKVIISGEGGALTINDLKYVERAEVLREKGTDRSKFFRGEVEKYQWQDVGSSYLPSELTAAYLYAQLEEVDKIVVKRKALYQKYLDDLQWVKDLQDVHLPVVPPYARPNGAVFYMLCRDKVERGLLLHYMKEKGIGAVFHYLPLHLSPFYTQNFKRCQLPVTENVSERILRLPLYYELEEYEVARITDCLKQFYDRL